MNVFGQIFRPVTGLAEGAILSVIRVDTRSGANAEAARRISEEPDHRDPSGTPREHYLLKSGIFRTRGTPSGRPLTRLRRARLGVLPHERDEVL